MLSSAEDAVALALAGERVVKGKRHPPPMQKRRPGAAALSERMPARSGRAEGSSSRGAVRVERGGYLGSREGSERSMGAVDVRLQVRLMARGGGEEPVRKPDKDVGAALRRRGVGGTALFVAAV